jgi:hypothetical protein
LNSKTDLATPVTSKLTPSEESLRQPSVSIPKGCLLLIALSVAIWPGGCVVLRAWPGGGTPPIPIEVPLFLLLIVVGNALFFGLRKTDRRLHVVLGWIGLLLVQLAGVVAGFFLGGYLWSHFR